MTVLLTLLTWLLAALLFRAIVYVIGVLADKRDERTMAKDVKAAAAKLAALHNTPDNGMILEDVTIYDRALSPEELQAIYNGG